MNVPRRQYRMGARAEAAEQTRVRIMEAAVTLFTDRDPEAVTLDAIAAHAGVTLQTVLRKFGSKDGLFEATVAHKGAEIMQSRQPERAGEPAAAVRALCASYAELGERNWRMLRYEAQSPALRMAQESARALHRRWLAQSFAALLPRRGAERERRLDALFSVTDFYLWKLWRMDLGRSPADAEAIMRGLVETLAAAFEGGRR